MNINFNYLAEYLRENYPTLGAVREIELLEHNNIHSINYLVFAKKGKYVLRNFIDGSSKEKIEKICKILDFCLKNGAKVPKPLKNKDNKYVDGKRRVYLTSYYQGGLYNSRVSELKDVAKNIAVLHLALAKTSVKYNYRIHQEYYKHLTSNELRKIKHIVSREKSKDLFAQKVFQNIDYLAGLFSGVKKVFLARQSARKTKQLTHNDLHPGNIILCRNKVAVILDFNNMRKGDRAEDIAFAAFRFACYKINEIKEIKKRLKIFIDAYLAHNMIEPDKLSCLHYYYIDIVLARISFILKKKYFSNSCAWSIDFDKNINFLRLAQKIGRFY